MRHVIASGRFDRRATLLVLMLAACGDASLIGSYKNSDPEVEITLPGDGARYDEAAAIEITAVFSDHETANEDLSYSWLLNDAEAQGGTDAATEDGASLTFSSGLDLGAHQVTIKVLDTESASAEDTVEFSIINDEAPTVAIIYPFDGETVRGGQSTEISVEVDDDGGVEALTLSWTAAGGALTDCPTSADSALVSCSTSALPEGDTQVCVSAIDALEQSGEDCVDISVDGCTPSTYHEDADGDGFGNPDASTEVCDAPTGYVADDTDCDDGEPGVNPDADEVCDGIDQDCDDEIDEDVMIVVYADVDGDGYGDESVASEACEASEGFASVAGDCDDTDAAYNPGADESDCTDPNDYDCDGSVEWADDDGDGHAACEDCDDSDAAVNPDGIETCDDVDDDCDGDVDEDEATDAATWYADGDGDGYGDSTSTTSACDQPSGYVADDNDCDDGDEDVNPAGAEVCDALDNDCDGEADEDDAVDASTWYVDADADGYGDPSTSTRACDAPSGYVDDATDCDDADVAFHPGADESDCTDPNDYDCDGSVEWADGDGDGYAACEDCDDASAAVNPGATETCNEIDDDCDGDEDEDDADDASIWYADTDGDGCGDTSDTATACEQPPGYAAAACFGLFEAVAGGSDHSLALASDGTVWAWGWNAYGQLGDGTTTDSLAAAPVSGLADVVAISAGDRHSLALLSDGTVWAWGSNAYGQLGDGTTTDGSTPAQVAGMDDVVAVSAGSLHSVALHSDGTVSAWGLNVSGQLGDGTTTDSATPVEVSSLSDVIAISSGGWASLALLSDGTVWGWGENGHGQLGDGTNTDRESPVQVSGLVGADSIGMGSVASFAVLSDGTAWAWGYGQNGNLGDGSNSASTTPVQVSGLVGVIAVSSGYQHTLALLSDGTVWGWGWNHYGQLGYGSRSDYETVSTPVQAVATDVSAISAEKESHSLVVLSDGTAWAWGYNGYGQLGDGTTTDSASPVAVSGE